MGGTGIVFVKETAVEERAQSLLLPRQGRCVLIVLARESMWNPNGPVHAAQALQTEYPLELLPPSCLVAAPA